MTEFTSYNESFPSPVNSLLSQLEQLIRQASPEATTDFKYGMPTFVLHGINLVHYAGYAKHIGFYPTPTAIDQFAEQLKPYVTSKGAVQFPLDKPLPTQLIIDMVRARNLENATLAEARKGKKKGK